MQRLRLAGLVGCIALAGVMGSPVANADDWNRKTLITFSGPVEIPGVHLTGWGILPAGTYVFKILDSQSDRHIVQIFNKDETTIYATILAIPNHRLQVTDKTVITFSERPAGEPEALRAWFYPGRNWGEEFVYPKERAIALAKSSNVPVLYTPAVIPIEIAEPVQSSHPILLDMKRAPIMAMRPSGEDMNLSEAVTPPPALVEVASTPQPSVATLPVTAGTLPLIGLLGLIALASAFVLRACRSRFQ